MRIQFSNSLVARALRLFVLLAVVIGLISLLANYYFASQKIRAYSKTQIEAIISTVEPSAQIAAFLNDKSLAREIARGLVNNPIVARVEILDSDNQHLVAMTRTVNTTNSKSAISRELFSPFDASAPVGVIVISMDEEVLAEQRADFLVSVIVPTVLQSIALILAVTWAGLAAMFPRVKWFMFKLESLDVKRGEQIKIDTKKMGSEIANIATYINGLLQKMYSALDRERQLRQSSEVQAKQLESIFENARTGIFLANKDGSLISYNHACQLLSLREGIDLSNSGRVIDIFSADLEDTKDHIEKALENLARLHLEIFLPAKNGHRETWLQLNLTPIDKNSIQGIINDISSVKSESIAAQNLARTDPLTQLGNRLGFETEFQRRLSMTNQGLQSLALMSIDLDKFKAVNDTLGHDAGDQVLLFVANQLRTITRSSDYICRMGGDEFFILLDGVTEEVAAKMAARIVTALSEEIVIEPGVEASIGASIGVVYAPKNTNINADDLMRRADKTMYKVKNSGRNNFTVVNLANAS